MPCERCGMDTCVCGKYDAYGNVSCSGDGCRKSVPTNRSGSRDSEYVGREVVYETIYKVVEGSRLDRESRPQ